MIEVRVTRLPLAPSFRKALQTGKGIVPKGTCAKGYPGNSENIRFTVAFAESYRNDLKGRFWVCFVDFCGSRFVRVGSIFF
jgi:hypothetical protein